jgi:hypothetical protein
MIPCYLCGEESKAICQTCERPICSQGDCVHDDADDRNCSACAGRFLLASVDNLWLYAPQCASEANVPLEKVNRFATWETWEDLYSLTDDELDRLTTACLKITEDLEKHP